MTARQRGLAIAYHFLSDLCIVLQGGNMDFRDKVEESLGGLENLTRKIPGYSGYKDSHKSPA